MASIFRLELSMTRPRQFSFTSRNLGVPDHTVAANLDSKTLGPIGDSLHLIGALPSWIREPRTLRLSLRQRTFRVHDTRKHRINMKGPGLYAVRPHRKVYNLCSIAVPRASRPGQNSMPCTRPYGRPR
jgi:hypothetical protein